MENNCTLHDIELCEKGVENIWRPNENGEPEDLLETYVGEAYYHYLYCTNCQGEWKITSEDDFAEIWKLVKEHLRA